MEDLLDRYMPDCDVSFQRAALVFASPEATYSAARQINLMDVVRSSAIARLIIDARLLPERAMRRLQGKPALPPPPARLSWDDLGWTLLAEEPGCAFALGAVGQFFKAAMAFEKVAPEDFASFRLPGYAKVASCFSVVDKGDGRTLLVMDSRCVATDPAARRQFLMYWRFIRPGLSLLAGPVFSTIRRSACA